MTLHITRPPRGRCRQAREAGNVISGPVRFDNRGLKAREAGVVTSGLVRVDRPGLIAREAGVVI